MSFKLVLLLAWRKITFQKTRSIVMALPIVVMVAIIVALSGWVGGFKNFIDREVLEPVARQSVLLTVEYPQHQVSADPYSLSPVFTSMSQDKVTALESLPGVSSAAPSSWQTYPADITFDDIPLQNAIVRTRTLDSSLSSLFGATDFVFHPGQPIPIIISGQALQEFVIDFGDKDTITRSTICNMPDHSDCQGPIKQVDHRELLNQQLIGQMGTMSYQLMPKPPQVISSYQGSQQTFRKASQKQLNAYQHQLERIFSPYWDLDQLEQPEQFRFRVVGIDKSRDLPSNYIPTEAAVYIYNRLHQRQAAARTSMNIPGDKLVRDLHASYLDQNDDVQIRASNSLNSITAELLDNPYWSIPGLVAKPVDNGGKLTLTEISDFQFTAESLVSNSVILRLTDESQRRSVQEALQDLGVYSNPSEADGSAVMMSYVLRALAIVAGIVSLIAAIVVFILSWGFVADANYEIGLLRAMGASGWGVRGVMMAQILMIVLIGAVGGLGAGVGLMIVGAPYAADYANTSDFFNQVTLLYQLQIQPTQLYSPDYGLLSLSLLGVLILPVLLTAAATFKRLKVNPLEALKNDF